MEKVKAKSEKSAARKRERVLIMLLSRGSDAEHKTKMYSDPADMFK